MRQLKNVSHCALYNVVARIHYAGVLHLIQLRHPIAL